MSALKWRPSPAMLVAALAVTIAFVGTAAAGPIDNPIAQDSRLTKKDRRIAAKISRNISLRLMRRFSPRFANQEITKRAPGLSVANATNATNAENADNAESATNAEQLGGISAGNYLRTPIRRVEAISANTSAAGQFRDVTASCPEGERAIAGGGMWTQTTGGPTGFNIIQGTRPVPYEDGTDEITGWQATGITDNAAVRQLRAYAICVPS